MLEIIMISFNRLYIENLLIIIGAASSNGTEHRDHNQISVSRDSRDSRDDREDSGSEDDSAGRIRVGKDYQVITPNWVPPERKNKTVANH